MEDDIRSRTRVIQSRANTIGRAIFGAILAFFLIVVSICTFNAFQWVGKIFPGFLLNERMCVAPVGQYHWPGINAGLKYPDRIISANDKEVDSMKELEIVLARSQIGGPITYEINRAGSRFAVTVPSMRFTWFDLIMTFGTTFLSGIAFMLIGTVVFIMKPNRPVSWALFIGCTFLSFWSITIFDIQSTHFGFIRFYLAANALAPAAFVHSVFIFQNLVNL
jgi:hypothetical protein